MDAELDLLRSYVQAEKKQQAAEQAAAAVTAAVAESVVGSPRPSGSATPSLPHTPTASTGGLTPRDIRVSTSDYAERTLICSGGTVFAAQHPHRRAHIRDLFPPKKLHLH